VQAVGGHKLKSVNLGEFHAAGTLLSDHPSVRWHTASPEDVSVTVMAQVDEASLARAFSSTSW